jgi:hypothetical protein
MIARALLCPLLLIAPLAAATPTHPNIIFIVSDDQGWAGSGYQSRDEGNRAALYNKILPGLTNSGTAFRHRAPS